MTDYTGRIVTYSGSSLHDFWGTVSVENGKIKRVSRERKCGTDCHDFGDFVIFPGFVDTHVHLPQIRARGRWSTSLLEWLERHILPEEKRFLDAEYTKKHSELFFRELAKNGTTAAMVYGPPSMESTDIAFETAERSGLRIYMGQTLMDQNVPEELVTDSATAVMAIRMHARRWNTERLKYVVTLRFAPACSMQLMKSAASVARELNLRIQTHISEQKQEVALVKEMYELCYARVYDVAGVLTPRTVLAHAIHLNERELALIASRGSKIAHCPSSNFFLHSGVMPLSKIEAAGIDVGVGSDVAAGPSLNMFHVLKDAYHANPISPEKAFYLLTLGGAKVVSDEQRIGTIEPGKAADFTVVEPPEHFENTADLLASLIFTGDDRNIVATYVAGREVYHR